LLLLFFFLLQLQILVFRTANCTGRRPSACVTIPRLIEFVTASTSTASLPPININVLPTQSYQTPPLGSLPTETPALDMPSISALINCLNILSL
jgi:hypothetical protein